MIEEEEEEEEVGGTDLQSPSMQRWKESEDNDAEMFEACQAYSQPSYSKPFGVRIHIEVYGRIKIVYYFILTICRERL